MIDIGWIFVPLWKSLIFEGLGLRRSCGFLFCYFVFVFHLCVCICLCRCLCQRLKCHIGWIFIPLWKSLIFEGLGFRSSCGWLFCYFATLLLCLCLCLCLCLGHHLKCHIGWIFVPLWRESFIFEGLGFRGGLWFATTCKGSSHRLKLSHYFAHHCICSLLFM